MEKRILLAVIAFAIIMIGCNEQKSVVAPNAVVKKVADGFKFTEGPAVDKEGNIYFTDIPNNRIHKWSLDGKLTTFKENTDRANGLFFDKKGNLIACVGGGRKLIAIDPNGNETVLVDKYKGKMLNSPNDLWIAPDGRIYFTDPRYGKRNDIQQDGEHVYCIDTDRKLMRVINDMVRPNGLIGAADGRLLYVSDRKSNLTYVYKINPDGTLLDKKLFAIEGSDGMTIDNEGNVYMTTDAVVVYNRTGEKIETIKVPETPANVCFGGRDRKTLFITARKSLYAVQMRVKGIN
ncbi:MAG: SMP-30/gluconolactonase/LRE family protein [Planctomycetota bacterium]|jgi:gluconolactonase